MVDPIYFIAHGGGVSNPQWLYDAGIRAVGLVVDGSAGTGTGIPNIDGYKSAGFTDIHINPFNDGTGGLEQPFSDGYWSWWFASCKNAGYTAIAGEGVMSYIAENCVNVPMNYLNYGGDITGSDQWDVYGGNPRGTYSNSNRYYHAIETYCSVNILCQGSTKSVLQSAVNHGAGGVGILIGTWAMSPGQSGATWIDFINNCRASGIPVNSVTLWTGRGWDITPMIQSGVVSEIFATLRDYFGAAATWGGSGTGDGGGGGDGGGDGGGGGGETPFTPIPSTRPTDGVPIDAPPEDQHARADINLNIRIRELQPGLY